MLADRTRQWRISNPRYGAEEFYIKCPGCKGLHIFTVGYDSPADMEKAKAIRGDGKAPVWTFNRNLGRPTFQPSMLVTWGGWENKDSNGRLISNVPKGVCHSFVTDGKIQFLNDCTHALKGQTVDLPEVGKD